MKKKLLVLSLALAMVLSFTACNNDTAKKATATPAATVAADDAATTDATPAADATAATDATPAAE